LNEIEAMNATSRAILQTVLSTDASLSVAERSAAQRLIDGKVEAPDVETGGLNEGLLVTQKRAAELLSVSRATIWRMTKDCILHPVEILPGTLRYSLREVFALAQKGSEGGARHEKSAA
jgi:predicted DNA-binding transcriptional regulator AlpA